MNRLLRACQVVAGSGWAGAGSSAAENIGGQLMLWVDPDLVDRRLRFVGKDVDAYSFQFQP